MADRSVTYHLVLDDQFSAPLKRAMGDLRQEVNRTLGELRRGVGVSSGAPAGAAGASAAVAGGSGSRPILTTDSHFKEIISRIGYTNRLLEKIASQQMRPGAGPGNPVNPGGGGPAQTWGGSFANWGAKTRIGGMALTPGANQGQRWAGIKVGAGVVGAGVMVYGHRLAAEADQQFANATTQADVDAAQANSRWASGISAGGKILTGAAAGSAGGPLGAVAGAAGGAIASVDELAEAIVGFSKKAEEANERLNKISPFESKRRTFIMAAENNAADQAAARYRHNSGVLGELDSDRADSAGMAFEREQARERAAMLSGSLSKVGGSSLDPGTAAKQAQLAREAVEAKQREGQLLRQELDLKRQSLDLDIKAAEESRKRAQADLERIQALQRAKQEEISGLRRDFGQLNKSQQRRTGSIAEKLDRGEKLTRSEERFARKQRIFDEDFKKIDEQRGRDAGFDSNESLRRRAEAARNGGYSVDQLKGQEANAKLRIETANQVVVELKQDRAALEKQFQEALKPVIDQIESLVKEFRLREQGRVAAQNAAQSARKAASQ